MVKQQKNKSRGKMGDTPKSARTFAKRNGFKNPKSEPQVNDDYLDDALFGDARPHPSKLDSLDFLR